MGQRTRNFADALIRRFGLIGAVASLLCALLITLVALVAVSFLIPLASANRNIAIGDVFGGGIFLLATVAAVVAILAYYQSSRTPRLETRASFFDEDDNMISPKSFPRDESGTRAFADELPACVHHRGELVPLKPATLWLQVNNTGDVAAKNVAVLLRLEGIYFSPRPQPEPGSPWGFFSHPEGWKIQWEGGGNRAVYPGEVPRTPSVKVDGMWALSKIKHGKFGAVITFADDLKDPEKKQLEIDATPLPGPATTEEAGSRSTSPAS